MRRSLGGFAAAVGLLLLPLPALAQRPIPRAPPSDTLRSDTVAADTAARPLAPPDTLLQQLLRLPGYTATEYGGDSAVFRRADETLRLRGNAEVVRTPERLTADSIVYFRREERVEARGSPRVTGGAQEFEGEVLLYDLARRRATVLGGRTEFAQGANWRITGDLTAAEEGERFYAADTRLTTDDRPEPQYHFRVGRVLVVRDRILVGRPAWLYFGDVPVFPLPFVFQNLEQGRASGILTPRFGINDIVRTGRTSRQISDVGYYWAINQYLGAQASVDWRSGSYTALQGGVDFRWTRQFLNGSFSYRQFFRDEGGTERSMSGNGSWRPDERTNLAASGSYASSSAFVRRESVDPLETVRNLTSNFAADRGFDWGRVSLGATRAQQVGTGRVESTFPSLGISVNPVTLFEDPLAQRARWYNNVTISGLGPTLVRTVVQQPDLVIAPGDTAPLGPFPQDREQLSVRVGPSIRAGNLQLGTNFQLNRETLEQLLGAGLFEDVPRIDRDRGSWNASLSYQQTLIGSTTLSPTLQLGQELVRDTSTDGRYLLGPRRTSFGASVNTDLYGFYPGFGPYSAFRHHFKPGFSYAYEPEVTQTAEQLRAFGPAGGRARNIVRLLNLTNTFEAKLRALQTPPGAAAAAGDTVAAGDTAAVADGSPVPAAPAAPLDPRKVTVLAITTSGLEYDLIQAREEGSGFRTETISNTVTSDYLNGLSLSFTHTLFEPLAGGGVPRLLRLDPNETRGRFAPFLSQFNTGFSFGQGSALFRFLGLGAREPRNAPGSPGVVPDTGGPTPPRTSGGTGAFTGNPQGTGAGPWTVRIDYSLIRPRPASRDRLPNRSGETQTLNANLSFSPTRNWAVNWNTSYSLTDREFGFHSLRLRRDLYRWQANFDFTRTPNGNTSFDFSASLKDLPELRVPFRERNIGRGGT